MRDRDTRWCPCRRLFAASRGRSVASGSGIRHASSPPPVCLPSPPARDIRTPAAQPPPCAPPRARSLPPSAYNSQASHTTLTPPARAFSPLDLRHFSPTPSLCSNPPSPPLFSRSSSVRSGAFARSTASATVWQDRGSAWTWCTTPAARSYHPRRCGRFGSLMGNRPSRPTTHTQLSHPSASHTPVPTGQNLRPTHTRPHKHTSSAHPTLPHSTPEERGWRKAGAENVTQRSAAKLQLKPAIRSKPVTLAMQHELVNHALPSPASTPRPDTPCHPSPPQDTLHAAYTRELKEAFGITFNELFTITNMPIKRFADLLYKQGAPQEIIASLQRRRAEPTQPGPSSRPIPPRRRASEATRTLPGKRGAVPHESCMRLLLPV